MSKENITFNKDALRKMNASTLKSLYELSQEILNEKILNGEIELGPDDF